MKSWKELNKDCTDMLRQTDTATADGRKRGMLKVIERNRRIAFSYECVTPILSALGKYSGKKVGEKRLESVNDWLYHNFGFRIFFHYGPCNSVSAVMSGDDVFGSYDERTVTLYLKDGKKLFDSSGNLNSFSDGDFDFSIYRDEYVEDFDQFEKEKRKELEEVAEAYKVFETLRDKYNKGAVERVEWKPNPVPTSIF